MEWRDMFGENRLRTGPCDKKADVMEETRYCSVVK
jgi:hypothetical protein